MCENNVLVTTPLGKIRGNILKTWKDNDLFAFRGIPYAESTIGENRFRSPVPKCKWDNVLDATTDGSVFPQMCTPPREPVDVSLISEDALILNVYTRNVNGKAPVLFYMHGGAFMFGGSHSEIFVSPTYILEQNLVFVSINYRLGPFGFLSTGTKHAPGNFGFKDQVLALKWVRDNISAFGGDPNCVTICGHSAGAMSVSLHLLSPMSQGLFHRAISMSGSSTSNRKSSDNNISWTKKLAKFAKCPSLDDPEIILKHLRSLSGQQIVDAVNEMDPSGFISLKWHYEIEQDFGQDMFLNEDPTVLFARGNFAKVPVMAGITKDEFRQAFIEGLSNIPKNPLLIDGLFSRIANDADSINAIKQFYIKDGPITAEKLAEILSDIGISHGVHRLVQLASKYTNVYYYQFNYKGRFSFYIDKNKIPLGVAHGDCLGYFIRMPQMFPLMKPSDPEATIIEKFTRQIGNFVNTGNPNPNNQNTPWETAKSDERLSVFVIDKEDALSDEPYREMYMFFDKIFPVT